jgi:hypothetical protein
MPHPCLPPECMQSLTLNATILRCLGIVWLTPSREEQERKQTEKVLGYSDGRIDRLASACRLSSCADR